METFPFKKVIIALIVIMAIVAGVGLYLGSGESDLTTTPTTPATTTPTTTTPATTTPATTTPIAVSPTPASPNTGSVIGRLLYTDNTPAYPNRVYIFKQGASISTAVSLTDANGYYRFSYLPVGDYEVYAAIYRDYSLETPYAKISIYDQQVTTVPLIIVPREIDKVYCDGLEINYNNNHITAVQPSLSWTVIPNASTYSVTITSNPSATPPGPIGYNNSVTTLGTNIIWTTLQPGSYKIEIRAFDQQNTLVGIGSEWFVAE